MTATRATDERSTDAEVLPMFPLGSVLFPSMILPLRVFEPRYQLLTRTVLEAGGRFGVVLIERGSEVGGGDVRSPVGCVATILRHEEQVDGQWFLVCVGTSRCRVLEWMDDDPYPVARVERWDDPPADSHLAAAVADLAVPFRTVLGLAAELDKWSVPVTIELSEDPVLATHQMAAVSPFGPLDRYRLLGAPTGRHRAAMLSTMFEDSAELLRAQLGSG